MADTVWFTGTFRPPPEVAERNLPRLDGEGVLVSEESGFTVRGTGYDVADKASTRRRLLLLVLILAGSLALADTEQLQAILGTAVGFLLAWALYHAWRNHTGRRIDKRVAWDDVERVDANEDLVVFFLRGTWSWGIPVPNPLFFVPDDGTEALLDEVRRRMPA